MLKWRFSKYRQALLILGSENIHRRQLSPIEEARYYKSLKDRGMSVRRIAESVSKSRDHIRFHLNLLDLPDDIQARIHAGEIPYSKARQLTILTREPATTTVVAGVKDFQPAPRTTRHFDAIRVIADEAAKGGSLKTERAVAEAARLVKEGVPVQDARAGKGDAGTRFYRPTPTFLGPWALTYGGRVFGVGLFGLLVFCHVDEKRGLSVVLEPV